MRWKWSSSSGEVFNEQLFAELEQLQADLENPDTTGEDLQEYLGTLDQQMNSIVNERAELGARSNRIEMIESRLADQKVISNKIMSNNEEAGLEEVITNLTNQQTVHQAALASAGRIMQTTFLDFLR
ncbi:flagellin [Marinococcus luteus]|uniref:flagellin n=1 Tax=Marinococcus luteus TaxID=1122204 RepID=UPI0015A1F1D2|nr:flagellin [Marinococcus luteus]